MSWCLINIQINNSVVVHVIQLVGWGTKWRGGEEGGTDMPVCIGDTWLGGGLNEGGDRYASMYW